MTVVDEPLAPRRDPIGPEPALDPGPAAGHGEGRDDEGPGGDGPTGGGRLRSWWSWLSVSYAERLWPTVTLIFVLAATATVSNSWGWYVGDNRFEQYWNPARRIAKSLTIWDGSRGLGRVREDFWPATTLPIAALRGLGASPMLAEHLFHALVITMAGAGMVVLVRLFRPRIGIEHLLAGLLMSFGAFSATFLLPSNLYYHYALAPWLFVVVFRGVHSPRPWRWAAMFALLTFSPGNVDTPGLVYNLVPLVSVVVFLAFIERSVRLRDMAAWFGRAFVLSLLVNAVVLAKTVYAAGALGQRLNDTEAADTAAITSSWPESFRGLGNWLSYYTEGSTLLKPQGEAYFSNWLVVLCTFVPPCVALFVLWQSRWRVRILYAMVMLSSLVILVGAFPKANPSPLGGQVLKAYTNIKVLTAFRNTYKIGAGLVIGVSALFAYGVLLGYRSLRRRRPGLRLLPIVAAFLAIGVVAHPFWTGTLYDETRRMQDVPGYWSEAFDYLGHLPNTGRSLVLPQTSRTRYRWGWAGDDIFDALDTRNHALVTGVPLSTPIAGNVLEAVTLIASDPNYQPGELAPIARRLGITEVVLRNDVDWQDMQRPRPSAFDAFRRDPDFERVATFGAPGENTRAPNDVSSSARREKELAPVEIYALRQPTAELRTTTPSVPFLVSGDGFGWTDLARAGLLAGENPLSFTGAVDPADLAADLERGAPIIVTDSNRRRLRVLQSYEADYSATLAAGQDLDRPTQSLWKRDGTQSVAWFPDATQISMSGTPRSLGGTQLWIRPANAFDGDPSTAWTIRRLDRPLERVLRVDLRRPTSVSRVRITLPEGTPVGGGIRQGNLRFSDGSVVPVDTSAGDADLSFTAHTTDWIEYEPTELGEGGTTVGIAEMTFDGLDLTEHVQTPTDVALLADADPELARAVAEAPTGFVFARGTQMTSQPSPPSVLVTGATTDEETTIRRRFRTVGSQSFDASGQLRVRSDTSDRELDALIGGERGGWGTHRFGGALTGWGGYAVDGDPTTAWLGPAQRGEALTVRFPRTTVSQVDVASLADLSSTRIKALELVIGSGDGARTYEQDLTDPDRCAATDRPAAGASCQRKASFTIAPTEADELTLRVVELDGVDNPQVAKVRIDEVTVNGEANPTRDDAAGLPTECRTDLTSLEIQPDSGRLEPLPVRLEGTEADLLAGRAVSVQGCDRVTVPEGWHRLVGAPGSPLDQVQLLTPDLVDQAARSQPTTGPFLVLQSQSSTRIQLTADNDLKGTILYFEQSYDPGWRATVNGRPLGPPREMNAVNGWVLNETGPLVIELQYNPQKAFGLSIVISGVGLVLCIFLAVRVPRAEKRARRAAAAQRGPGG